MIPIDYIQLLIHRISIGYFTFSYDDTEYLVTSPSNEIKYHAELLYTKTIEDNLYSKWFRKDSIILFLNKLGLWSDNDDNLLTSLEKQLDHTKLHLYENRFSKGGQNIIRKELESIRKQIDKLNKRKYSMDHLTLEDFAMVKKNEYIIANTLKYKKNNKLVFNTEVDNIDSNDFEKLSIEIGKNILSIDTYKEIAKNNSWKNIWYANKYNVFNRAASDLTEEQKTLISLSLMYDRIYEHPECPSEAIIADNDMLDGWMIDQKRKNEAQKKESQQNILANRHPGAKEIFVVAQKEEVEDIESMNTLQSQMIKKQRNAIIKSRNEIDEKHLPDVVQQALLSKG